MNTELLCTLGPSSMNEKVICRLEELGASLFRINLSHVKLGDLSNIIEFVRNRTSVPICLDTEGAQIRTGDISTGTISVINNSVIQIARDPVPGDMKTLNFYPPSIVSAFEIGDLISIDFHTTLAQVIETKPEGATLRVLNGGRFGANKAVSLDRPVELPPLTEKDYAALEIGIHYGIKHVALSFANQGKDVDHIRTVSSPGTTVIAKIECRNGLRNLDAIAKKADALLIDRGDLSREIPIEQIPPTQKMIMEHARTHTRKVYVATNLLESMVTEPTPTRAEVNDIYNTLLDGADGLVLAAETAIGAHPIGCANMIAKLVNEYEQTKDGKLRLDSRLGTMASSLLIEPHGGQLVDCQQPTHTSDELSRFQRLRVNEKALIDSEQIALGTYSPLQGFMDQENLESVLTRNRLADNTVWTMPILLPISESNISKLSTTEPILLTDTEDTPRALVTEGHFYQMDLPDLARRWFGTDSREHPGVTELMGGSGWFLAGPIVLLNRLPSHQQNCELTPSQARHIFTHKGWSKVVAFHTRNVIHRAHEHIIMSALNDSMADGLLLSPLTGPTKSGDYLPGPIIRSYQTMLEAGLLPSDQAILGSLMAYPRYAGPREAVFTALCRKNMGCSHFIVGRDHAGVGNFYNNATTQELFDQIGDVGIKPIFFNEVGYNPNTNAYEPVTSASNHMQMISGSEARKAILENRTLPEWYMRPIVQDQIRADIEAQKSVFND